MDRPARGLAALGRREKTGLERALLDPEVIAMRNLRIPTLQGSGRTFEAGKDVEDFYARIWNRSDIVAGIRVDERHWEGTHARTADMTKLHVLATGVIKEGDLVSVFHGKEPDHENQHIRVVTSLEARVTRHGDPVERVSLGPALGLDALPEPIKRSISLTTLGVDRKDETLSVRDGTGTVLSTYTAPTWHGADHLEYRIKRLIESCAREGRNDRREGRENGVREVLDIVPASDGKGRRWDLVNKDGRVFESAPRSIMDRKPPADLRELFHVGTTAYEEAFDVTFAPVERRQAPVSRPAVEVEAEFSLSSP